MAKKDVSTLPATSSIVHGWMVERLTLMVQWRLDGSEGVHWHLRGLSADGAFYGEVRFQSAVESRCYATLASGRLSPPECERVIELVQIILRQPLNSERGPRFGALVEKLYIADTGKNTRLLYEYKLGDEANSESARAFLEFAGIIERHLSSYIAKVSEPAP
jgi:hypothetical protein